MSLGFHNIPHTHTSWRKPAVYRPKPKNAPNVKSEDPKSQRKYRTSYKSSSIKNKPVLQKRQSKPNENTYTIQSSVINQSKQQRQEKQDIEPYLVQMEKDEMLINKLEQKYKQLCNTISIHDTQHHAFREQIANLVKMYNKIESSSIQENIHALSESTEVQLFNLKEKITQLESSNTKDTENVSKKPKWGNQLNAIDKKLTLLNIRLDEQKQELLQYVNNMVTIEQHDIDKTCLNDKLAYLQTDKPASDVWVFAVAQQNTRVYRQPELKHEYVVQELTIDKFEKVLVQFPVRRSEIDGTEWISCRRLYTSGDIDQVWVPLCEGDIPNFTDFTFSSG